jgi:hypothetical protein
MSNQKKFKAPQGWVTAVHINAIGITEVAKRLEIKASVLALAMEESGFQMLPDPMDISADTAKVMMIEEKKTETKLEVVPNEPNNNAADDRTETA